MGKLSMGKQDGQTDANVVDFRDFMLKSRFPKINTGVPQYPQGIDSWLPPWIPET